MYVADEEIQIPKDVKIQNHGIIFLCDGSFKHLPHDKKTKTNYFEKSSRPSFAKTIRFSSSRD